jgi:hypothetical protein
VAITTQSAALIFSFDFHKAKKYHKWPGKLEHREGDPKDDCHRLGKKGYRRFLRKGELNGKEKEL